jgi:hypothetical protein
MLRSLAVNEGGSAMFIVQGRGRRPHFHQRQRNGVASVGATRSVYRIPAVTLVDERASFRVVGQGRRK